ncbi:hypothetical protein METSCH_C04810 [Metschnikowia aff. pulcherrima]|uniref:Uncharacterized protein n=1 Tax=Metschnikowia aff. pulcherrima TaxID=2163413 RepID=A0A4P6XMK5_9ASCO|nr:hypothetical protein METSCH_C04810 [Metschnikowia aff. pulcherrima]
MKTPVHSPGVSCRNSNYTACITTSVAASPTAVRPPPRIYPSRGPCFLSINTIQKRIQTVCRMQFIGWLNRANGHERLTALKDGVRECDLMNNTTKDSVSGQALEKQQFLEKDYDMEKGFASTNDTNGYYHLERHSNFRNGLLVLALAFILTLLTVAYVRKDFRFRASCRWRDIMSHPDNSSWSRPELIESLRTYEKEVTWRQAFPVCAAFCYGQMVFGSLVLIRYTCVGESWSKISTLSWPRARAFVFWTFVSVLMSTSTVVCVTDVVLAWKELFSLVSFMSSLRKSAT